jgi:H+/Cl- antiporter ClcA
VEKRFKRTGIFAAIVALAVFILSGAANGVSGELGVTVFQWLQQLSANLITMSSLPWIIIVLILLVALVSVFIIWRRAKDTLYLMIRFIVHQYFSPTLIESI